MLRTHRSGEQVDLKGEQRRSYSACILPMPTGPFPTTGQSSTDKTSYARDATSEFY